jgi:hypothetical protein
VGCKRSRRERSTGGNALVIVWIASYPRSGNSLLRQILFDTMDLVSYHDGPSEIEISADYAKEIVDRDEFFLAAASAEPMFVKTHLPPADAYPALYVVRDGRASISSFLKYEQRFSPSSPSSPSNAMLSLILGDHYYGDWSQHYRAWCAPERRGGRTLTLDYEQLFGADQATLEAIASFVGYDGPIKAWANPIDEWREKYPHLVGAGKTIWEPLPEWNWMCDAVFWQLHGDVMLERGFDDGRRVAAPNAEAEATLEQLAPMMKRWIDERHDLQARTFEKERVIQELSETIDEIRHERDLQAGAAQKRLATIEELKRERDRQAQAAQERLAAIEALVRERDVQASAAGERLAHRERDRA